MTLLSKPSLVLPILLLVFGMAPHGHSENRQAASSAQESVAGPVVLISRMRAKAGKLHELQTVLQEFYESVRVKEPGCLINIMHAVSVPPRPTGSGPAGGLSAQDAGDLTFTVAPSVAGELVFYEVYRDPAAAAAHTATPHFLRLKERLKGLVDGPIQLEFLKEVAGVRVPY